MQGPTVMEHFLDTDPRIQFVICGRVEDSFDGRRYHMHLERIAHDPRYQGRFGYFPEGALPPSLYRNLYLGCQYFVMPSGGEVGEPCGISQQEAHAGGTPVIAHHQDGLQKTVCDRDFGDKGHPPNGIKFSGFTGSGLLEAMGDAVSIYFDGQRRLYCDRHGRPRQLAYADLSFNAFCTDHRWLRLLRDYVRMYAHMLGITLPAYLDAVQLIVDINGGEEKIPGDAVLRRGLTVLEARQYLEETLLCPIASVRLAAEKALKRLKASHIVHKKEQPVCEPVEG
jgi:glycogen synthase